MEVSNQSNGKLVLISPRPGRQISQSRLAEVDECRKAIEILEGELRETLMSIEADLRAGATVEPGPYKAALRSNLVVE